MAKANPKLKSSLYGRWHIVSNKKGEPFIEFRDDGSGNFKFGKLEGEFNYQTKHHEGKRAAQFCWHDDFETEGIGWVIVDGDEMTGTISIHLGGEREFVAKRAAGSPQIPKELAVDEAFPVIAMFVQHYGHIEIGDQDGIGFVVRALDDGGLVLDDDHAGTLDEAMTALEHGLTKWFRKQGIKLEGKR
jgi:hypothetical protein